jgi:hypothetical protein
VETAKGGINVSFYLRHGPIQVTDAAHEMFSGWKYTNVRIWKPEQGSYKMHSFLIYTKQICAWLRMVARPREMDTINSRSPCSKTDAFSCLSIKKGKENAKEHGASGGKMQKDVLAEKEYIHRTQIEFIEKGQSCETLFCGVHTSIQLL